MSARFYIKGPGGVWQEIPLAPRDGWTLPEQTEECSVAMGEIIFDDPDMELDDLLGKDVGGLRSFRVLEDDYTGNDNVLWYGHTWNRGVARRMDQSGTKLTRAWRVELVERNTILGWRIVKSAGGDRPAETDVERIQWLISLGILADYISDDTYVSTAGPVNMDACQYQWQTVGEVIDDCLQASGKNAWIQVQNTGGWDYPDYVTTLWYGKDNLDAYLSPITLSNDLADLDFDAIEAGTADVWPFYEDAELTISPERVASGVAGHYANGTAYRRKAATAAAFDLRDISQTWTNVKTSTKAIARANRLLDDLESEESRVTMTVLLPAARVNDIRSGMKITSVKATHWPGWEGGRACRVLKRSLTPRFVGQWYEVGLDLIPIDAATGLSCALIVGAAVTVETSDIDINGVSTYSTSITPTAGVDSIIVAASVTYENVNAANDISAGTGYTALMAYPGSDPGRPSILGEYRAVSSASGAYAINVNLATTPAGGVKAGIAGIAFQTTATSPVSHDADFGSVTLTCTLAGAPTVGNLLVATVGAKSTVDPDGIDGMMTGWTRMATAHATAGTSTNVAFIYCRCVQSGDGAAWSFDPNDAGDSPSEFAVDVSEWELT